MSHCFLSFQAIFHTQLGEEIYLVGNHPSLGSWDVKKGLHLTTSQQEYPKWRAPHKIAMQQNYKLQFKICVLEGQNLKRWEYFPTDRNRLFEPKCYWTKIKIIEYHEDIVVERKIQKKSSDSFMAGELMPVKKYLNAQDSDEDSQSSEGSDSVEPYEDIEMPSYDLPQLIKTFKQALEIGIRTSNHQYLKHYVQRSSVPVKKNNETYTAWHFISKPQLLSQAHNDIKGRTLLMDLPTNYYDSRCSEEIAQKIVDKVNSIRKKSSPAIILHGFQFCFIPKQIKLLTGDTAIMAIIVQITEEFQQKGTLQINELDMVESLIHAECLVFSLYSLFQSFLSILQKLYLQFTVQKIGLHEWVVVLDCKPLFVRVKPVRDELTAEFFQEIVQLPIFSQKDDVSRTNDKDIMEMFQKSQRTKVITFSFGMYESLDILLKMKAQLNLLRQRCLIYIFTPRQLETQIKVIKQFPNLAFISATFLQIHYMDHLYSLLPGNLGPDRVYPKQFFHLLSQEIDNTDSLEMQMLSNLIFVRQQDSSPLAMEIFEQFILKVDNLLRHFNQTARQSLIMTRINTTVLEIRQAYQTKMFITDKIFKSLNQQISFMGLLMVNRFENFKYFKQLKHVLQDQKSLSRKAEFFGHVISPIKSDRISVLSEQDLVSLLDKFISIGMEDSRREGRKGSYQYKGSPLNFRRYIR